MQAKGGTLQERLNLAHAARKTVDASVLNDNSRVAVGDANGVSYAVNDDGVRVVADYAAPGTNVDRTPQAAFVFDWGLAFDEQYFHIKRYLLTGIGAAVAMVFVIMAMLIAHPMGATVATAMIVIIEVEVIGLLGLAGLKLNSITLINLIMIVGIAVEFMAHITRAAVLPPPGDLGGKTSAERAVYALYEMGPPVLNGAMSTLLAVICIAASSWAYFVKYFFGMYALTIVVCLWNSIVVLPILLSYIVRPLPDQAHTSTGPGQTVTLSIPASDGAVGMQLVYPRDASGNGMVMVNKATESGRAAVAGVQVGDVVISLNGQSVTGDNASVLFKSGAAGALVVRRQGIASVPTKVVDLEAALDSAA